MSDVDRWLRADNTLGLALVVAHAGSQFPVELQRRLDALRDGRVGRDTGAREYFELPLVDAWQIYREAMSKVSGLARTARGPSMSAGPGKVEVLFGERPSLLVHERPRPGATA